MDKCARLESVRVQAPGVRIPPVPPMASWRFAEFADSSLTQGFRQRSFGVRGRSGCVALAVARRCTRPTTAISPPGSTALASFGKYDAGRTPMRRIVVTRRSTSTRPRPHPAARGSRRRRPCAIRCRTGPLPGAFTRWQYIVLPPLHTSSGGGKANMAQAGGKAPQKIGEALAKTRELLAHNK